MRRSQPLGSRRAARARTTGGPEKSLGIRPAVLAGSRRSPGPGALNAPPMFSSRTCRGSRPAAPLAWSMPRCPSAGLGRRHAIRRDPAVGEAADQPQHPRSVPADPDPDGMRRSLARMGAPQPVVLSLETHRSLAAPYPPDDFDRLRDRADGLGGSAPRAAHGDDGDDGVQTYRGTAAGTGGPGSREVKPAPVGRAGGIEEPRPRARLAPRTALVRARPLSRQLVGETHNGWEAHHRRLEDEDGSRKRQRCT